MNPRTNLTSVLVAAAKLGIDLTGKTDTHRKPGRKSREKARKGPGGQGMRKRRTKR